MAAVISWSPGYVSKRHVSRSPRCFAMISFHPELVSSFVIVQPLLADESSRSSDDTLHPSQML